MIDVAEIRKLLEDHSIVREAESTPRGHVRIETSFLYPDGSNVDLYVVQEKEPLLEPERLSDLGGTIGWLMDAQLKPWLSAKRRVFLQETIDLYGVAQEGAALERRFSGLDDLVDGVVLLGQACVRVSDLVFTRRSSLQTSFTDDVEDVLVDGELTYEPSVDLVGRYGKLVRVDFIVEGRARKSSVLTWSSAVPGAAHLQGVEIFRKWFDLSDRSEQRVTIYDDRHDVYREEDLKRVRNFSDAVPLSDRGAINDLLAA